MVAGLADIAGGAIGWILAHYCLLGLILWILTLLAFLWYVVHNENQKKQLQGSLDAATGAPVVSQNPMLDNVILDEQMGSEAEPLPGFDTL